MICVFKCPKCGAKMKYIPETQSLVCDTCRSEIPVSEYDEEAITYEGALSVEDDIVKMECPDCGANIYTEDNRAVLKCGYCGSELAALATNQGDICPEKIITLTISEKQARDKVVNWWLTHESMPKLDMQKMKMSFQDIYIPVWLYDISTVSTVKALVNHNPMSVNDDVFNKKQNDKSYWDYVRMNNTHLSANQETARVIAGIVSGDDNVNIPRGYLANTKTTSSVVYKVLESSFIKIPGLASGHFSRKRFNGIEPYDYTGLEDFKSMYLSGHMAENYNFNSEDTLPKVNYRIKQYALEQCNMHVVATVNGGVIVNTMEENVSSHPENAYYALVPLWICTYYYKGKKHNIYVNGQTGKTDGEILLANRNAGIMSSLFGFVSILINLLLAVVTGVFLFDRFNGYAWGVALLLRLAITAGKKVKTFNGMEYNSEDLLWRPKEFNSNKSIIIRIGILIALIAVTIKLATIGFMGFNIISESMILSYLVGIILAFVSTASFASKFAEQKMISEDTEYKNYIKEASTKVLVSTRM